MFALKRAYTCPQRPEGAIEPTSLVFSETDVASFQVPTVMKRARGVVGYHARLASIGKTCERGPVQSRTCPSFFSQTTSINRATSSLLLPSSISVALIRGQKTAWRRSRSCGRSSSPHGRTQSLSSFLLQWPNSWSRCTQASIRQTRGTSKCERSVIHRGLVSSFTRSEKWTKVAEQFKTRYGRNPTYIARAPGRVK